MRIPAASCTTLRPLLDGAAQPARILTASPAAIYLAVGGAVGDSAAATVVGILSFDAVQLPGCLTLPQRARELPLSTLGPQGDAQIGAGALTWVGPAGEVGIAPARYRPPTVVGRVRPRLERVGELAAALRGSDIGIEVDVTTGPDPEPLLGLGPGLTPSGDDVLAGYLLGARAFGLDVGKQAAQIAELAARGTTALSAALLSHAAAGRCAPPVAGLIAACAGHPDLAAPLQAVQAIGATSGTALAFGVLAAGRRATAATDRDGVAA